MRNLFKVVIMLLAAVFSTSYGQAQSTTRPWLVGAGLNAVDFYTTKNWDNFYFKTTYWNSIPAISHLTLSRCLGSSFALDLQLGVLVLLLIVLAMK